MKCEECGIKIMASLARQQGEELCRECYTWKLARANEEEEK